MSTQPAHRVARVADTAASIQEAVGYADPTDPTYAYAAGVEDALRWMLDAVSPNVFSGFSGDMTLLQTLTAAAQPGTTPPRD